MAACVMDSRTPVTPPRTRAGTSLAKINAQNNPIMMANPRRIASSWRKVQLGFIDASDTKRLLKVSDVPNLFHRRTIGFMRRASRPPVGRSAKTKRRVAEPNLDQELVQRIRQRREEIRQRTGTLSDSTHLIREERDR